MEYLAQFSLEPELIAVIAGLLCVISPILYCVTSEEKEFFDKLNPLFYWTRHNIVLLSACALGLLCLSIANLLYGDYEISLCVYLLAASLVAIGLASVGVFLNETSAAAKGHH